MTRPPSRCALVLGALVGLGAGCAGTHGTVVRKNRHLEAKVAELRAEGRRDRRRIRDLKNRILVLEDRLTRDGGEPAPEDSADEAAPELPVEVLAPESDSPAATTEPAGEKPRAAEEPREVAGLSPDGAEIIYAGEAAKGDTIELSPERYDLGSERADPPPAGDRLPVVKNERIPTVSELRRARTPHIRSRKPTYGDPRAEYRRYYEALKRGDHATAIAGFRNFLKRFPHHDYADNAQYWLGEAFYDQKRFRPALSEFQKVLDDYPDGNKVPDAILKIAYCRVHLGDRKQAVAALRRLIDRYPRSNPAALAAHKLEELEE